MQIIEQIRKRAQQKNGHVVLPETGDERVLRAAALLATQQLCEVSLLGDAEEIRNLADEKNITLPADIHVINPAENTRLDSYADHFFERRKHKGISREEALEKVKQPLFFAASMVAAGDADGCVAGSIATTGDVLRAAIQVIGLKEGSEVVSSVFLMAMPDGKVFTYGDCGVVPYPTTEQLATIAVDSSETHRRLTDTDPRTAMLSFSTKGSAKHERVELVTNALEQARKLNPDLEIDGELQFDAAFVADVAKRKAPDSPVAGRANVFIFPNLDAGNIAYKITERLAGATATGPIVQGLRRPMMDLSRGCSWEDIVNAAAVSILMG